MDSSKQIARREEGLTVMDAKRSTVWSPSMSPRFATVMTMRRVMSGDVDEGDTDMAVYTNVV
jgi:hypothetical protein